MLQAGWEESMNNNYNNRQQGFRIYNDTRTPSSSSANQAPLRNLQGEQRAQKQMEIALIKKLHANTQIVGFLDYRGEIKGIRFYDPTKNRFMDVAPWHLSSFAMSKLKLMGVRHIELLRHEAGESAGTVVIEYLTKHEVAGLYRANRMIPNDLAEALSTVMNVMEDAEYNQLMARITEGS